MSLRNEMVRFVTSTAPSSSLHGPSPARMDGTSISFGRYGICSTSCRKAAERRGIRNFNTTIWYRLVKQFVIADRRFVTKICTSENRFSKIDIDDRFLLMQIFLTNRRSAAAELKSAEDC